MESIPAGDVPTSLLNTLSECDSDVYIPSYSSTIAYWFYSPSNQL